MQGTKPPTFRPTPTLWPAEPRADLTTFVDRYVLRDDRQVSSDPDVGRAAMMDRDRAIPDDFIFREVLETALTPDAVMSLMNDHGPLCPGRTFGIDEAIDSLQRLQVLSRAYLAYANGDDAGFATLMNCPESLVGAWTAWQAAVNAALGNFPMYLEIDPRYPWLNTSEAPAHTLYELAVMQLVVVLTEARDFHVCANETCGRSFTRHRTSRRVYGAQSAHSAGIKYCSQSCSKAQSERERRRRRRAEKP